VTLAYTAKGTADVILTAYSGTDPNTTGTGAATIASASYTAGARVTVTVGGNGRGLTNTVANFHVSSISGTAGLTFTQTVAKGTVGTGGYPVSEIWSAVVPGGGVTGTVVVNMTGGLNGQSNGSDEAFCAVSQWTDVGTPTIGVTGSHYDSGVPSIALSGLTIGSFVLAVAADFNAGTAAPAYGTGQTQIGQFVNLAYGAAIWKTTAVIAGTTQTMNMTAPTGQDVNSCAVEIKANAGAAAYASSPSDLAGLTDSRAAVVGSAVTDLAGLTDTRSAAVGTSQSDLAGLTDTSSVTAGTSQTDLDGLTDTASVQAARQSIDLAGVTDQTSTIIGSVVTDSSGLTDTLITVLIRAPYLTHGRSQSLVIKPGSDRAVVLRSAASTVAFPISGASKSPPLSKGLGKANVL
jgi:hypothetical protein